MDFYLKLKIGDDVELFNGTKGKITKKEFPTIEIDSENSFPQVFHWLNIKTVNNEVVTTS